MPRKARFSMDSGIVDAPVAVCLLTDLVEKGEGEHYKGYTPFKLCDYRPGNPGKLVIECFPWDVWNARKFLKAYLSGEAEKIRKPSV